MWSDTVHGYLAACEITATANGARAMCFQMHSDGHECLARSIDDRSSGGEMRSRIWGVCIWQETKGASRGTQVMIAFMFVFFPAGLLLLVRSMV
jgi:hypothetical protein